MPDFTQLPVKDSFKGCFDYAFYSGGEVWQNQYSAVGADFNMVNAVAGDGYVLFGEATGLGYLIDNIGNNFTIYTVAKSDYSVTAHDANLYVRSIGAYGASNTERIYVDIDRGSVLIGTVGAKDISSLSLRDWHIIAISVCNGSQKIYIDGELVYTATTSVNMTAVELAVNGGAYNGAVPTVSNGSANTYLKYIGYATDNHNEVQIARNCEWLAVEYGLKSPEVVFTAGTAAIAMAYAIGKNNANAAALDVIVKAYRDGIVKGSENDDDSVLDEDWVVDDDDDVVLPINNGDIDEDGNGGDGTGYSGDGLGNLYDGIKVGFENGTYVKVYVSNVKFTETRVWQYSSSIFVSHLVGPCTVNGILMADVYDANTGELLSSNEVHEFYYCHRKSEGQWYRSMRISDITISGNVLKYTVHYVYPNSQSDSIFKSSYPLSSSKRTYVSSC